MKVKNDSLFFFNQCLSNNMSQLSN
jgi:hypothetical protein